MMLGAALLFSGTFKNCFVNWTRALNRLICVQVRIKLEYNSLCYRTLYCCKVVSLEPVEKNNNLCIYLIGKPKGRIPYPVESTQAVWHKYLQIIIWMIRNNLLEILQGKIKIRYIKSNINYIQHLGPLRELWGKDNHDGTANLVSVWIKVFESDVLKQRHI